jgi:hypothetical protein
LPDGPLVFTFAPDAAGFQPDLDPCRARVEAVLDQLLDHRGRPLDDFAGGDLADQRIRQWANGAA